MPKIFCIYVIHVYVYVCCIVFKMLTVNYMYVTKEFTKSQIVFTDSYISLLRFFEAVLQNCEIMTVKCINVFSVCLPDRMFV